MDDRIIELSRLTDDELTHLAMLHHTVMHTLLSDLGLPMVVRYYQIARAEPGVLGLCMRAASGEILGWAVGSPDPDRISAQLRSPLTWFLLQMLRVMLTHPIVLWQLLSSVLSTSAQGQMRDDSIELTYIGVATDRRGKGLGKRLLQAFIEASRTRGYRSVVLSVEKENRSAISLYEREGFRIIKTFAEGRYQRHRMELTLA